MPPRVTIRPYVKSDAKSAYAAVQESREDIAPWMPWCHPDYDFGDVTTWIETTLAGRASGTLYGFVIEADDEFAGTCGINHINRNDRVANLGYWVRTSLAGRGIATAAVHQLIDWVFENTDLNRIEIVAAVGNPPSQRVAEKVGASRDAVLRKRTIVQGEPSDAILFSVIRPD